MARNGTNGTVMEPSRHNGETMEVRKGYKPSKAAYFEAALGKALDNPPASEVPSEVVEIKPLNLKTFRVKVKGTSPLLIHAFAEKAQRQIEDKQQGRGGSVKGIRKPEEEMWAACHVFPGKEAGKKGAVYGIPCMHFKHAMVNATRFIKSFKGTFIRGALFVKADPKDTSCKLVRINFDGEHPEMHTGYVTIGMDTRDIRYRPQFNNWSCEFDIEYNADFISPGSIVNLLATAGFHCGVGDMRCERTGGDDGKFVVATAEK